MKSIIFLLLLFIIPLTISAQDDDNGIWWNKMKTDYKVGYIKGWIDGADRVNQRMLRSDLWRWRWMKGRIYITGERMTFIDSMLVDRIQDSLAIEQRYIDNERDFGIIHNRIIGEILVGLDEFYSVEENQFLPFTLVIEIVKLELDGVDEEYIERMRQSFIKSWQNFNDGETGRLEKKKRVDETRGIAKISGMLNFINNTELFPVPQTEFVGQSEVDSVEE